MILKQLSFSNKLGDNIVTVKNNVLTHIFEDFSSYELFPSKWQRNCIKVYWGLAKHNAVLHFAAVLRVAVPRADIRNISQNVKT